MKNRFHSGSCWSRDLFDAIQGYAAEGTGHDLIFEGALEQKFPGSTAAYDIKPEEIYYIYRWFGTGSYHLSGHGHHVAGQNIGHSQVEEFVNQQASTGKIPLGTVPLQPHWKSNYQQRVNEIIQSITTS
jgi:hypothetical protein